MHADRLFYFILLSCSISPHFPLTQFLSWDCTHSCAFLVHMGFSLRLEMVGRVAEPTHSSTDWGKRETLLLLSVYMTLLRFSFLLARRHSGLQIESLPTCFLFSSTLPFAPFLLFFGSDVNLNLSLPRCRESGVGGVCCFG